MAPAGGMVPWSRVKPFFYLRTPPVQHARQE